MNMPSTGANSQYFVILLDYSNYIPYFYHKIHNILVIMRAGNVFINKVFAGRLQEIDSSHYVFDYDDTYSQAADARPVCCAMPLSCRHYESPYLFPFFSNLLSEGENRDFQSSVLKIDKDDDFGILLATANYDTIGSVTVIPVEQ